MLTPLNCKSFLTIDIKLGQNNCFDLEHILTGAPYCSELIREFSMNQFGLKLIKIPYVTKSIFCFDSEHISTDAPGAACEFEYLNKPKLSEICQNMYHV